MKNTILTPLMFAVYLLVLLFMTSCRDDEKKTQDPTPISIDVDENLLNNTKWYRVNTNGTIWIQFNSNGTWEGSGDTPSNYRNKGTWSVNSDEGGEYIFMNLSNSSGGVNNEKRWVQNITNTTLKLGLNKNNGTFQTSYDYSTIP